MSRSRCLALLFSPNSGTNDEYRWRVESMHIVQHIVRGLHLRVAVENVSRERERKVKPFL